MVDLHTAEHGCYPRSLDGIPFCAVLRVTCESVLGSCILCRLLGGGVRNHACTSDGQHRCSCCAGLERALLLAWLLLEHTRCACRPCPQAMDESMHGTVSVGLILLCSRPMGAAGSAQLSFLLWFGRSAHAVRRALLQPASSNRPWPCTDLS